MELTKGEKQTVFVSLVQYRKYLDYVGYDHEWGSPSGHAKHKARVTRLIHKVEQEYIKV